MSNCEKILSSKPIFIFASGQRCGSTLLQRLLNSHPSILIWGEHDGYLYAFLNNLQELLKWEEKFGNNRETYLSQGYDTFVPNMVPSRDQINEAAKNYIVSLFGVPAAHLNKPIWGFKEVRYGIEMARFLQKLFPEAHFIHMTRNIVDCFVSLKHWEESQGEWNREWTIKSLETWAWINSEFLDPNGIENILTVRYEDMISDQSEFIHTLAEFLNIEKNFLDQNIFKNRLHDIGEAGKKPRKKIKYSSFSQDEIELLRNDYFIDIAKKYDYLIEL
jgi:hypothetical protein